MRKATYSPLVTKLNPLTLQAMKDRFMEGYVYDTLTDEDEDERDS
jgi:MarR-like DNA-binding transcriptional regulator SgrR of sgrS sRNA